MGEVNGDPPLGRRNDLPDAVLVAGVDVREGGTGDGAVSCVYDSPACIFAPGGPQLILKTRLKCRIVAKDWFPRFGFSHYDIMDDIEKRD